MYTTADMYNKIFNESFAEIDASGMKQKKTIEWQPMQLSTERKKERERRLGENKSSFIPRT